MRLIIKTLNIIFTLIIFTLILSIACAYSYQYSTDYFQREFERHKSNAYLQAMYKKIVIASGQKAPPLVILPDKGINARATIDNITVNQGMVNYTKNDNEIALVLAHELSHYQLKHVMQEDPTELSSLGRVIWQLQKELNADKLGAFYAMQAGYDVCSGREIWKRLKEQEGDVIENLGHPTDIFRYVNLKLPQCRGDL